MGALQWLLIIAVCLFGAAKSVSIQQCIEEGRMDLLEQKLAEKAAHDPRRFHKVMAKLFSFLTSTDYIVNAGDSAQQMLNILIRFRFYNGPNSENIWVTINATFPDWPLFPPCSSNPFYSDNELPMPKTSNCCPIPDVTCRHDSKYRTIDGSCNCKRRPNMGRSNRAYARILAPDYADEITAPRVAKSMNPLPSARKVSTSIFPKAEDNLSGVLTMLHMTFGQMVDHDTDRTPVHKFKDDDGTLQTVDCGDDGCATEGPENVNCFPIPIPDDDGFFTKKCIMFVRSQAFMKDQCKIGPREQPNVVTSWLDCSIVYGSTQAELDLVRDTDDPSRGKLKVTKNEMHPECGDMCPHKDDGSCRDVTSIMKCFQTGDARQNEQNGVTAFHIILVRLHNKFEQQLHEINPHWDGERLFQETRRIVIAVWQNMIYQEYLPPLLGPKIMNEFNLNIRHNDRSFNEYDCKDTNADVTNVFATAAFRFGHAQIGDFLRMANPTFDQYEDAPYSECLFRPRHLYYTHFDNTTCGIDSIFFGHASQSADKANRFATEEMTKFMFSEDPKNKKPGTDLFALDVERGRDHGIAGYTRWREVCGLSVPTSFEDMDDIPAEDAARLVGLYENVEDVDLFVGAMLERHVPGGIVGPTFACLIAHQFRNLKVADRFWFERNQNRHKFENTAFTKDQIKNIRKYTTGRLFCDTLTNIITMQPYPMMLPRNEALQNLAIKKKGLFEKVSLYRGNKNRRVACSQHPGIDLEKYWKE